MHDFFIYLGAILYAIAVAALLLYASNFCYLTFLAWRNRAVRSPPPPLERLPTVTVQLPVYNELYVVQRLIGAVAALDYPRELLEIQVLDDSTDETAAAARAAAEQWRARGIQIAHLHRDNRSGFKAGALAEGMARARGEFFAIFDADFIPPPDFLRRTLPYFENPRTAFVQTRWEHINRDYSFLTLFQAIALDAHFMIEQFARSRAGLWFNFNGTAGVWRRAAIEDAGGWSGDTLAEDLDLSYRVFLRGWRAEYVRDIASPAELPVNFNAYRLQHHRWARGSFECALKFMPPIWRGPFPFAQKLQATFHLTGNSVYLLVCALNLLYPTALLLSPADSGVSRLFDAGALLNLIALAYLSFFAFAQHYRDGHWWRRAPLIFLFTILGAGMMLNGVRAALQALSTQRGSFDRTPKFGIAHKREKWAHRRYQLGLDSIVFVELAVALLDLWMLVAAVREGNWAIALPALLFCLGLLFTSGTTIAHTLAVYWPRTRVRTPEPG